MNLISKNSSHEYILEVDLEYPDELYGFHNDYSLAQEKLKTDSGIFSMYCSDITDQYDINVGGVKKLLPNLCNKNKYVLYYRNLQLYLSLGIKSIGFYKILNFKQSDWLKKYR